MKLILTFSLYFFLSLTHIGIAQSAPEYNDGPYLKYFGDSIEVLWIDKGKLNINIVHKEADYTFSHDSLTQFNLKDLKINKDEACSFSEVKKYVALSDIHGQFDVFRTLLISQKIVNENDEWIFDDGHLVIVGDVLDRGPKVIETLWYIYHLENKAKEAGGRVHLLLGNHELMVINKNIGYINKKYRYTSGITKTIYSDYFKPNTFFGRWLSSKNIVMSINDALFVHGGFSPKISQLGKPISELNGIFQKQMLFNSQQSIKADSILNMLYFDNGPLWYRGYAFPSAFDKDQANYVLQSFGKKRIIVGHTSMPTIKGLYGNRIILVDSSMKFGKSGQLLMVEDSVITIGKFDGSQEELISEEDKKGKKSIFTTIYEDPEPILRFATSIKTVYKNDEETYEESILYYFLKNSPLSFHVGIRTSGNMRRRICSQPPLKINFKKKELKAFGFKSSDKFKILMPCKRTNKFAEHLRVEHLIYELYNYVDTISLRSKLATIIIDDVDKKLRESIGLLIEHKDHFAKRTGVKHVDEGVIRTAALDREDYIRFGLFQYIIANPDWELTRRHNLVVIKKEDKAKVSLTPYDFDYSGLINAEYAVPHESLPIESVAERYFMDKSITMEELGPVLDEFLLLKDAIIDHCENVDYLEKRTKSNVLKFINKSFQNLENRKKVKRLLGLK